MEYPKKIKIENPKLKKLLEEKAEIIGKGRAKSEEIEKLEIELGEINQKLIEEEKKVDLTEFHEKEKEISKTMDECISKIKEIREEIVAKIKENTPQELRDEYDKVDKLKEEAEIERNKFALKAQKYNDKIIPMARKIMSPYLENEFDDYDSLSIEDGNIICSIFNHLEEFKINFNKKRK
jgi:hypothetical protein